VINLALQGKYPVDGKRREIALWVFGVFFAAVLILAKSFGGRH
jgi:hypothetical protein